MKNDQQIPPQTVQVGARIVIADRIGDYDGAGYRAPGAPGIVVEYATPDIQAKQVWPNESYYVRLDGDAPQSRRVFDRREFVVVP